MSRTGSAGGAPRERAACSSALSTSSTAQPRVLSTIRGAASGAAANGSNGAPGASSHAITIAAAPTDAPVGVCEASEEICCRICLDEVTAGEMSKAIHLGCRQAALTMAHCACYNCVL